MFHLPPYARHQYLAAQAEAKAAEAAAKAMEAEYLASEALRQEEEALKARLYDIEQRKKYSRPSHLPTTVDHSWALPAPVAPPHVLGFPFAPEHLGVYGNYNPSALYHPGHELKAKLREEREALRAAEQELKRKEKEIAALRSLREVPQPPFYAAAYQPAPVPQRGPEKLRQCHFQDGHIHRERVHPHPHSRAHHNHAPSVSVPTNVHNGQDFLSALFKDVLPYHPSGASLPLTVSKMLEKPQPNQEQAAPSVSKRQPPAEALPAFLQSMLLGQHVPQKTHCHKHAQKTPAAPVQSSSKAPASAAARSDNVIEQLKARYEVDNDDEMRDTIKAIIESLKPESSEEQVSPSSGTDKSLIEQLQSRYHKEEDQELRDTIQATINSLADSYVLFSSPSPPSSSTPSSSSVKGKAKDTSTPSSPTSTAGLQKVNKLAAEFRALEAEFTFPFNLDFVASSTESATAISRLAFTARNHPVRFYEQSLTTLLSDLDLIESHGDLTLRNKRKEVVTSIEEALDSLEREIIGRWNSKVAKDVELAQSSPKVPTEELESVPAVPTESTDLSESTVTVRGSDLMADSSDSSSPSGEETKSAADDVQPTTTADAPQVSVDEVTSVEVEREDHADNIVDSVDLDISPSPSSEETIDETTPLVVSEPKSDSVYPPSVDTVVTSVPYDAEDVDENSFLLAQPTQLSPEVKKRSHKVEIEDLGSDWSDVDA